MDRFKRLSRVLLATLVFLTPGLVRAQDDKGPGCTYQLTPTSTTVLPAGKSDFIGVLTDQGCAWIAEASQPWITITSGDSGTGPGTISYTVAANTGPQRMAQITVADQVFQVTQFDGCEYDLQPPTQNFPTGGGTGNILVQTAGNCSWTAETSDQWISITSGSSGTGPGTVGFSVASNDGNQRNGFINIAGIQYAVTQDSGCNFELTPTSSSFGSGSASSSFSVTTEPQCSWTATTEESWIIVTNGEGRQGSGTLSFSIGTNSGPERVGTISVNGTLFTITQADGCSYSLSPSIATISADAAQGTFMINTNNGCQWTVQSNAPWLSIVSATSGSGPAEVTYAAQENTGPPRVGTITAAGRTFTVNQSDGCVYFATPTNLQFEPEGGDGEVSVVTGSSCEWQPLAGVNWITVTDTETQFGPGTFGFDVEENLGPPRNGSITVETEVIFVQQADGCVYPLVPTEADYPAPGGSGSFDVNTQAGCDWTARTDDLWISITSGGSGEGPGTVDYTVAANTLDQPRTGTIEVEDSVFTITQDEACLYTVDPVARQVPVEAGEASFDVGADEACFWMAVADVNWLTVTENETGFGPATVMYEFDTNEGPARQGTITVVNAIHTVTQEDSCEYDVDPLAESFEWEGDDGTVDVSTAELCPWTAESNDSWIVITDGENGTGDGTVEYTVAENTGPARTGSLTVAGETVVIDQNERPLSAEFARLGLVGAFGYTDLTNYEIAGHTKGVDNQEFMLPDTKTGSTTYAVLEMLSVNSSGEVTGIADMRVEDIDGMPVEMRELPVAGRISYRGRNQESIFPKAQSTEGELTMLSVVNARAKVSLSGRSDDRLWQLRARGSEKNTQFFTDDTRTGIIGQEGFTVKLSTKAPSARGRAEAVVRGWVPEDGEVVFSRDLFQPFDEKLKRWTADAVLLTPFSPFVPVAGGTSSIGTKWYDPVRDRPGRIRIRSLNGDARVSGSGLLFTTFDEAAMDGFIPDDLQSFLQKVRIATRGAREQISIDWDDSLLVPIPPPAEQPTEPAP